MAIDGVNQELSSRLGKAAYSARQSASKVTIIAEGENPTGGWKNYFVRLPLTIWPPQFAFCSEKPDGFANQQITPYSESTSFRAEEPVSTVTVVDLDGLHSVEVVAS